MKPSLPIVGARFRPPAEDVLNLMPAGSPLVLRRQPENPHDVNAIQVLMVEYDSWLETLELGPDDMPIHLGFIPRKNAVDIAPLMDEWWQNRLDKDEETNEAWPFADDIYNEWPATLTFSMMGKPFVAFDFPTTETSK